MTVRTQRPGDWTTKQVELLRGGLAMGWSHAVTATVINAQTGSHFSRNACIGKAGRIGISLDARLPTVQHKQRRTPAPRVRNCDGNDRGLIEHEQPPPQFLGIPFYDLEMGDGRCRYPRGGNDGAPILFCGQPAMSGSSYCPSCHAVCHARQVLVLSGDAA